MIKLKILLVSIFLLGLNTRLPAKHMAEIAAPRVNLKFRPVMQAKKKSKFSKTVWSTIESDQKVNSLLFYPLNEKIPGLDYETDRLDITLFEQNKTAIQWNLFTIIIANILNGNLTPYSTFNLDSPIEKRDRGFLNSPVTIEKYGYKLSSNISAADAFQTLLLEYFIIGTEIHDPFASPLKSQIYIDEDSLMQDESGYMSAVYPAPTKYWYSDKDVVSYQLKEEWILNAEGQTIDKKITAIAPSCTIDHELYSQSERLTFWIDFKQLSPILSSYLVLLKRYKKDAFISFTEFFNARHFYSTVIENGPILLAE